VSQEPTSSASNSSVLASTHFIRNIIEADLAADRHALRRWSGRPGPAAQQLAGALDPARIRTRFPPEPNGYLHFGHAKSICLNFGLAQDYGGRCHLRFDDTNPEKEEQEYVDSIIDSVRWLGFSWDGPGSGGAEESECNLYFASNYFDWMVQFAEYLIASGHAYVDSQSAEVMRATRGTLTDTGTDSPFRQRGVEENMDLFKRMQQGEFPDGAHVLRAKIDMAAITTPAIGGAFIPCTPMLTRSKTRLRTSPTRSARSNSPTSGRFTTGCSSVSPKAVCCSARYRSRSSSPASI
jgi:glutaminyl-tRNA synthetase